MNKQLLLLFLSIFGMQNIMAQEYIREIIEIDDPLYENVNHFGLEYYFDSNSGLRGYKKNGKVVIPPKYDYTQGFCKKGIARVTIKSPYTQYDVRPSVVGGYLWMNMIVDNDGLNGFIDTLGNVVIPIKYSALGPLEVYSVVPYSLYFEEKGERIQKYGLINDKGEIIVEPIYDFIIQYGKVYKAEMFNGDKRGDPILLDDTGKELGNGGKFEKFIEISPSMPNMYYAENNGTAYLLNENLISYITPLRTEGLTFKQIMTVFVAEYTKRYGEIQYSLIKSYQKVLYKKEEK